MPIVSFGRLTVAVRGMWNVGFDCSGGRLLQDGARVLGRSLDQRQGEKPGH
jgi:hypothetical protein